MRAVLRSSANILVLGSLALCSVASAGCARSTPATAPPETSTSSPAAPVASAAPAAPPPASTDPKTSPKLRLGHYSSPDGTFGIVLDRLASPPRVRVDGTNDVWELALRRHAADEDLTFITPRADLTVTVSSRGSVSAYVDAPTGAREVRLVRDADAQPLAAAVTESPDAAASSASSALQVACGATIDVRFAKAPTSAEAPGAAATVWRTLRALRRVCRDQLGKSAVVGKIRHLRIGAGRESTFRLSDGTFDVNGDLEGETRGPFSDEIQHFLEGKL